MQQRQGLLCRELVCRVLTRPGVTARSRSLFLPSPMQRHCDSRLSKEKANQTDVNRQLHVDVFDDCGRSAAAVQDWEGLHRSLAYPPHRWPGLWRCRISAAPWLLSTVLATCSSCLPTILDDRRRLLFVATTCARASKPFGHMRSTHAQYKHTARTHTMRTHMPAWRGLHLPCSG